MNGCPGITSIGLSIIINSCHMTLLEFQGASNDQPNLKNDLLKSLAVCWNLESLDLTGCS
jgi:hypothetical protein